LSREHSDGDFPFAHEFNASLDAHQGIGVLNGCSVDEGVSGADMEIRVNAGTVTSNAFGDVAVAEQTPTVTAAHASLPRYDVVTVDPETGSVTITAGTPQATPAAPARPAGDVILAVVAVAAAVTSITNADIVDARIITRSLVIPGFVSHSIDYAVAGGDLGKIHHVTGTTEVTLPNGGIVTGFNVIIKNAGTGTVSFTSAATINAIGTSIGEQWGSALAYWDGTAWYLDGRLQ
jgi:hypothetical protein